jgi:hypothetical protein
MSNQDEELELLRSGVSCAVVLENIGRGWKLDRKQSTRRALKYRCGAGNILIINHEGRGWWDPQSTAKGDVFDLVQRLEPGLNFGQVRQVLRRFVGVVPRLTAALPESRRRRPDRPLPERWCRRPRLRPGSAAWCYLCETRRLPEGVIQAASDQDAIREGAYGSAWFAHRDRDVVTHVEVRGPDFRGSLTGGRKTLFRFAGTREKGPYPRLVIAEAPIDALSIAAIEGVSRNTLYVATGGGMGPATIDAITAALAGMVRHSDALLASAADADTAGDRYAARHAELAAAAGVAFARLRPPDDSDWNDVWRGVPVTVSE